jgi:hypothetical protein
MPYTLHPSEKLVDLFREKPWQGCEPYEAQFLFIGLDANYAADIERTLPEIFDYLSCGPDFWRKTSLHHPFRLPHYKGSGKRYHDKFAEIGFKPEHADFVSFVELLHLPTTGRSPLTVKDLSTDHLRKLSAVIDGGKANYVFASSEVIRLMKQSKVFPWLDRRMERKDGTFDIVHEQNGQTIYQMYHFSCYGHQLEMLNRQIAELRQIVKSL